MAKLNESERKQIDEAFGYVTEPEPLENMVSVVEGILDTRVSQVLQPLTVAEQEFLCTGSACARRFNLEHQTFYTDHSKYCIDLRKRIDRVIRGRA